MNRRTSLRILASAVVAIGFAQYQSTAHASSGEVYVLPKPTQTAKAGLQLEIDTRWVNGNGYRPVRITFRTANRVGSNRTRRLTVSLAPNARDQLADRVTTTVVLDQGAVSATTTLLMRQRSLWYQLQVEVREGGVIPELSADLRSQVWSGATEAFPTFLFIDSDAPPRTGTSRAREAARIIAASQILKANQPTASLPRRLPNLQVLQTLMNHVGYRKPRGVISLVPDAQALQIADGAEKIELLHPTEVPTNWLSLTNIDIISLSVSDCQNLSQNYPDAFKAIREWTKVGGCLWITGVGARFQKHEEVARLLGLPVSKTGELSGWSRPSRMNRAKSTVGELQSVNTRGARVVAAPRLGTTVTVGPQQRTKRRPTRRIGQKKRTTQKQTTQPRVVVTRQVPSREIFYRRLGFGTVLAFGTPTPYQNRRTIMTALNELGGRTWMWFHRHGMSTKRRNESFWNLLIDGVGDAPVVAFLILITLFAFVIGPVNFVGLRRSRRQHLMVLTVPGGAAAITTFLIIYSTVSDGFGVKVRTRSVVYIDQQAGESTTWSRQSYYASMAPSRGLVFPADAAVYQIRYSPKRDYQAPRRNLVWDGDTQRLASGYMSSRDWCQVLVMQHRKTTAGLLVTPQPGAPPRVVNQLGTKIVELVLVDEQKNIYFAEDIPNDQQANVIEMTVKEAAKRLESLSNDNVAGTTRSAQRLANTTRRQRRRSRRNNPYGVDRNTLDPRSNMSLMERDLVDALEGFATAISGVTPAGTPKPRPVAKTYIAVVENSTEVPLGTSARRYDSFEVVIGRW